MSMFDKYTDNSYTAYNLTPPTIHKQKSLLLNPPYIKLTGMKEDLYISFMKKACCAKGFVSITPQTFTNSSISIL